MRAGKLRHRITIQRPARKQDPNTGEMREGWEDVAPVWASREPISVREFIAAKAGQAEISARIMIRYRAGIDATMRVLYRDTVYNIEGVLPDPQSGRHYLTLPVSAGVNDG